MGSRENRKGARIAASFWVGIEGIDEEPALRQGNLSATGLFIEHDQEIGVAGSVQFLHIASEDHRVVVQVLARVIRTVGFDDLEKGQRHGIALQFMPASEAGRHAIDSLVRHVVQLGLESDREVLHRFEVGVEGRSDRSTVQRLSVQKLVLETSWDAQVGDRFQFDIRSRSTRVPVIGQVIGVESLGDGYRIIVHVTDQQPCTGPKGTTQLDEAFADLIATGDGDFELPARDHMSGQLARIRLPSLLSLFEMEHMSGVLELREEAGSEGKVSLSNGRIADARCGHRAGRDAVMELFQWKDGEFHFEVASVPLPKDGGLPITPLLLDIAREVDESSVDAPLPEIPDDGDYL
jgi:hypothetical protein